MNGGTRFGRARTVVALLAALALLAGACSSDSDDESSESDGSGQQASADLPEDAVAIMESAPYESARWSYLVVDPATDEVLYSNGADVANVAAAFQQAQEE